MVFTNCKKILLALALSFNVIPQIYAEDAIVPQEVIQQQNEYLENTLKNILAQYNALDLILQDLQSIITNDQVAAIKNKRVMVEEIKNMRQLMEQVQKESFAELNPIQVYMLNNLLDALVQHVGKSLSDGFVSMAPFDMEGTVKRAMNTEVEFDNLDQYVDASRKKLEGLSEQARTAGLVWYNKIYRKIDDYVIQPSIRHSVPQRAGKVLLGAAILTAWWFNTDRGTTEENLPMWTDGSKDSTGKDLVWKPYSEKIPLKDGQKRWYAWEYWLRNLLGAYPHVNSHGDLRNGSPDDFHYGGKNQVKLAGDLQMKMIDFTRGNMPIFAYLFAFAPVFYRDEIANAYEWMSKKVYTAHNFLRGGAFRNLKYEDNSYQSMSIEPKITFKDLVGLDHPKEVLSMIVKYIEDPERWDRGNLKPEKGYLLTGPTRTGKSYIAEALAGEIRAILKTQNRNPEEFGFYVIKASFILKNGIAQVLDAARREAPCVLFIDEIDLLGLQRTGNKELLNEFLLAMSGTLENDPKRQVIILAATNKPQNLDEALKQRGRFGKEIRFEYPNYKDRQEMIRRRLNGLVVNTDSFDLVRLALETEGCSFEDLNTIVKTAFQKAKLFGTTVKHSDLDNALDTEVRNIIMHDTKNLPAQERELMAVHQAGHALAAVLLPSAQKLAKVTIRPVQPKLKEETVWDEMYKEDDEKQKRIENGKMFTYHAEDTLSICTRTEKVNGMKIHLAGAIAEEIILGGSGYSYHSEDKDRALKIAQAIVAEGVKVDKLPKKLQNEIFDKAYALLDQCKAEVTQLLQANKEKLQAVAKALQTKMTLSAADVMCIIETGSLPEAPKQGAHAHQQAPIVDAQAIAKELGFQEVKPESNKALEVAKAVAPVEAAAGKAVLNRMLAEDAINASTSAAAAA